MDRKNRILLLVDKIAHQSQVLCRLSIWLQEIFQTNHPRNICHCSLWSLQSAWIKAMRLCPFRFIFVFDENKHVLVWCGFRVYQRMVAKVEFFVDFRFGCRRFFERIILEEHFSHFSEDHNRGYEPWAVPFCPCLMTKRCTGLVCQQIQPLSIILLIPKEELRTSGISIQDCCCPYLCIQFWKFNIWPCGLLFVPSICSSLLSIISALRWASRALALPAVLNEPVLRHQELMKFIAWSKNGQSLPLIWWR